MIQSEAKTMKRSATILFLVSVMLPHCGAETTLWPGWMGPDRNGWVENFSPPKSWPEKLALSWQTEVGAGYGTPVVAGKRVFQHARQGESEVLICLDRTTGKQIWKRDYPVPFRMGMGAQKHGKGPKSSPIYADGRVFTMSITGRLSAWDAESGELLWKRDYDSTFEKTKPYWGVATSPVVDGDQWTVKELWHQDELALDMSTAVINADLLYGFSHYDRGRLFCLDPETGEILWTGPPRTGENVAFLSLKNHIVALLNDGQLRVIAARGEKYQQLVTYRVSDGRTWAPPVLLPDGILTKDDNTLTFWLLR
jgi:outer membrane protein assembly factor BamB